MAQPKQAPKDFTWWHRWTDIQSRRRIARRQSPSPVFQTSLWSQTGAAPGALGTGRDGPCGLQPALLKTRFDPRIPPGNYYEQISHRIHWNILSGTDHWLFRHHRGLGSTCSLSYRFGAHADDLCRG